MCWIHINHYELQNLHFCIEYLLILFLFLFFIIWQFLGLCVFIQDAFEWSKLSVPRQIFVLAAPLAS